MAKEKTDATSLFSAMNKNRAKTTTKVKTKKPIDNNDLIAQNEETIENTGIEAEEEIEAIEETDTNMTQSVNEKINNTSNVTADINSKMAQKTTAAVPEETYPDAEPSYGRGAGSGKQDKDLQHIHIALPRDVFDKLEIAKKAYYNNKTTYIRNLILDDYEKNREYYEKLPNIR